MKVEDGQEDANEQGAQQRLAEEVLEAGAFLLLEGLLDGGDLGGGVIGAADALEDLEAFLGLALLDQEAGALRGEEQRDEEDGGRDGADAEHPAPAGVLAPQVGAGVGDEEVDEVGQEDADDGQQLVGGAQGAAVLGGGALGDVGDGERGGQADADAADDAGGDQGRDGGGEGRGEGGAEEAGGTDEEDLAAADLVHQEAGDAHAEDAADHDGGDHQALHAGRQAVVRGEELDGARDAHGVVAIEQAGHAGRQRQDDHVLHGPLTLLRGALARLLRRG
ncbi:MAG: hypothetical protein UHD09_04285 [Bifidobacterium sp.]|nr:hypothetical protein [Bifidobacterium sp.]